MRSAQPAPRAPTLTRAADVAGRVSLHPLLVGLSLREVLSLCQGGQCRQYKTGEIILPRGRGPYDGVYLLVTGRVSVGEEPLGGWAMGRTRTRVAPHQVLLRHLTLASGGLFTDEYLAAATATQPIVFAEEACEIVRIRRSALERLFVRWPEGYGRLERIVSGSLSKLARRTPSSPGRADVRERRPGPPPLPVSPAPPEALELEHPPGPPAARRTPRPTGLSADAVPPPPRPQRRPASVPALASSGPHRRRPPSLPRVIKPEPASSDLQDLQRLALEEAAEREPTWRRVEAARLLASSMGLHEPDEETPVFQPRSRPEVRVILAEDGTVDLDLDEHDPDTESSPVPSFRSPTTSGHRLPTGRRGRGRTWPGGSEDLFGGQRMLRGPRDASSRLGGRSMFSASTSLVGAPPAVLPRVSPSLSLRPGQTSSASASGSGWRLAIGLALLVLVLGGLVLFQTLALGGG